MNIPTFTDAKITDENGNLTQIWKDIFFQLLNELQDNASDEGLVVPQQTTTNIGLLDPTKYIGALIYDSDTNEFKVNINGTYKVVQVV